MDLGLERDLEQDPRVHQSKVFELYHDRNEQPSKNFKQENILVSNGGEGLEMTTGIKKSTQEAFTTVLSYLPPSLLSKFLRRVDCSSISRSSFHSI